MYYCVLEGASCNFVGVETFLEDSANSIVMYLNDRKSTLIRNSLPTKLQGSESYECHYYNHQCEKLKSHL
jgi:hypothetical protein